MQLSLAFGSEDGGEMDTSGIPLDAYPVELRDGGRMVSIITIVDLESGNYRIAEDQNRCKTGI